MRIISSILLMFLAICPAWSQDLVCPFVTIGWTVGWVGQPILSVGYDQSTQLLYIVFSNQAVTAFSNVPTTVMQGFSMTSQPLLYYQTVVYPAYHALLLANVNNCPILFENGAYIWTK